jgi:transposase
MMGHRQVDQAALFYEFSLETHVPGDHLLRSIDRFVELGELRRELAAFYSTIGRPSVDPELMLRMLIVGYCFGIRSERRLCEEIHLNLAYRWFCGLGLDGRVPDHSTFSKNRHGRFRQSDLFRRLFETVLRRGISERLVGGEGFAVDASLIKADANRQKGIEGAKGFAPEAAGRAVKEYLAVLDDAAFGAAPPRSNRPEPSETGKADPGSGPETSLTTDSVAKAGATNLVARSTSIYSQTFSTKSTQSRNRQPTGHELDPQSFFAIKSFVATRHPSWHSLLNPKHFSGRSQVGFVDHFSVEAKGARIGARGKGSDDLLGPLSFTG